MRQNPDHLLDAIRRSEGTGRGQLKIFLGMSAGVGKTYAMLQRAHSLRKDGIDAVVGWVDTHGRKETAKLLDGLEVLPRRSLQHQNVAIEELDLDALLKRRPKVAIVDELAHTNAPGSRHAKRYQDVLELLAAGIDVYTTVNVQHLESRVDTVKSITGVIVHETVPDSFLDGADEIVLIDLPPEELIKRLQEGRIYPVDRIDVASRNFFKPGNLTALREIALRTATGRVDRELRLFKTLHGIEAAWKSSTRLMVAVFASPYSESLIRWTRQLADAAGATWVGAYVDTGQRLGDEEKRLLEKNTQLVRQLGGDFAGIEDQDLVGGLLRIARQNHVTQIIVGKSQRGSLRNLLTGGSVVDRLLRKSGDIDIYAVATEKTVPGRVHRKLTKEPVTHEFPWSDTGWAFGVVFLSWLVASMAVPFIGYQAVGILFLMSVMSSGLFLARSAVFVVALSLSLIHNFFFIPPTYTFRISNPHDALMHLMFFMAASAVGHLTTKLKQRNRIIEEREDRAIQLFNLANSISEAADMKEVVRAGVQSLHRTFAADVAVILYSAQRTPTLHEVSTFVPDAKEMAVAEWSRLNDTIAGRFTETLPSAEGMYLPLRSKRVILGVVGLRFRREATMDYAKRNLAQALAGQLAAGIEREQLHDSRRRLDVLEQAERLHRSLFDSVSHELKTPLTTIQGAATALGTEGSEYVGDLASQIRSESERLLAVVNHMLDMTRLESGSLKPILALSDVADILGPALTRIESLKGNRTIQTTVAADVRPLRCDGPLTVQALASILHNAVSYTPEGGIIQVFAENAGDFVELRVRDDGAGLPKENPSMVFEKFYRDRPEHSGGVGLGLSIAKGFLEAQGGSLSAANHPEGGAVFTLRLPAA